MNVKDGDCWRLIGRRPLYGVLLLLIAGGGSGSATREAEPLRWDRLMFRGEIRAHWFEEGSSFWYRVRTGPDSYEYVRIEASTGTRIVAADFARLGVPLSAPVKTSALNGRRRPTRRTGPAMTLRFTNGTDRLTEICWLDAKGQAVNYGHLKPGAQRVLSTFDGHVWLIRDADGEADVAVYEASLTTQEVVVDGPARLAVPPRRGPEERGSCSPDGRWCAWVEHHSVWLRDMRDGSVRPLTTDLDGQPAFDSAIQWSPDSTAFVVSYGRPVSPRTIPLIESTPSNSIHPRLVRLPYLKPGDPLPQPKPVLFRISETGQHKWILIESPLATNSVNESLHLPVRWAPDSCEFYFDHNQRGHQVYRVLAVRVRDGAVRCVVEERSSTVVNVAHT